MINSLKELRENVPLEDLDKYYKESSGKNAEEIRELLKGYNVEVSLECANECYEFCKRVVELDEELASASGGIGNSGIPEHIAELIRGAIFFLEKVEKSESSDVRSVVRLPLTVLKFNLTKQSIDEGFKSDMKTVHLVLGDHRYSCPEINKAFILIDEVLRIK